MRRLWLVAILMTGVLAAPARGGAAFIPTPGTTWQIQFSGEIDTSLDVDVYDLDSVETEAATVGALHDAGRKVICYVNAGAWEKWRDDADDFPASVKGKPLDGWPGERWLDIRQIDLLDDILRARMDTCAAKGFDGIEFDNVDGYQNRTGFPLDADDQVAFNEWLAAEATERGLAPGLKNALGIVDRLVDDFAFAINEQCLQYRECAELQPFIDAGKAVFHIEYEGKMSKICAKRPAGFSTIRKKLNLNAYRKTC